MIGSGILTLPWTFYHSGMILGTIICFLSYLASLRTCHLIYIITEPRDDFYDTIKRYWGKGGYYMAMICTLIIILSSMIAYFLILCQMLYPIILALMKWIFKLELPVAIEAMTFNCFSQSYVSFIMYFIMTCVCLKRDMSIFIKMTSYGAISIILTALFIIGVGLYSLVTTNFKVISDPAASNFHNTSVEFDTNLREIFMFNNNFTPLAGVLGIGYFLHPISVPIIRNNKI